MFFAHMQRKALIVAVSESWFILSNLTRKIKRLHMTFFERFLKTFEKMVGIKLTINYDLSKSDKVVRLLGDITLLAQ